MARKAIFAGVAVAAVALLAGCANTAPGNDTDPSGNGGDGWTASDDITFIVPYAAGSGPDGTARIIAAGMEKELGTSVIIENKEGGSSTIGLYDLARSEADGYTIGWGTSGGISIQSRLIDNPFQGIESLTAIAQTNLVPNVMFASPDRGWNSIDDFIAAAKERPGEITVGLGNRGSSQDIQVALLEKAAGIDLKPVYFDAGQMILPAVNGTVDVSVAQIGPVVQYVEAGDLQFIGTLGGQAPEGIDAPSFDEAGYDTSLFQGWEGVFGPAGLDESVTKALSDAVGVAMESQEYIDYAAAAYSLPNFLPYDEFAPLAVETYEAGPGIIEEMGLEKKD